MVATPNHLPSEMWQESYDAFFSNERNILIKCRINNVHNSWKIARYFYGIRERKEKSDNDIDFNDNDFIFLGSHNELQTVPDLKRSRRTTENRPGWYGEISSLKKQRPPLTTTKQERTNKRRLTHSSWSRKVWNHEK